MEVEKGETRHEHRGDLTKDLGRVSRGNGGHLRGFKQPSSINKLLF